MRMQTFAAITLAMGAGSIAFGQWKPAEGPLTTPWTADVSPENVWTEYPRPQLVRQDWKNLNGLWSYAIVDQGAERPEQWTGEILVPFPVESALSGVMERVRPNQALWYRRTFERPAGDKNGRVLLHFGAVDWEATVFVNGQEVGRHQGGFDPFSFDVTDALQQGENEIVVRVWDPTDAGHQPRGKQVLRPEGIWYVPVTGIWQTVWLEPVPATYIESLKVTPDLDRSVVHVNTVLGGVDAGARRVEIEVFDGEKVIATGGGRAGARATIPLHGVKTWSPDDPFLYGLRVTIDGDAVESYFGMRKIEVRDDEAGIPRLFLNNEPVFHFGPLDQGWWPDGLYTAASDGAQKYDIEITKKLGFNMARKHVKVEPARWYYWADKLGLLVWQDMPSGSFDQSAEGREIYKRELEEMIKDFDHFPSIVMWVPFNEGWGQHETEATVRLVERWDPTRLVNNASGWTDRGVGDVHDVHIYPGPGMPPVEDRRAAVLGEYGGLGLPVSGHTWQDEANWGYRSYESKQALEEAYIDLLKKTRMLIGSGLAAAVYTQTSDVEIEVNGLLTYDRKVIKVDVEKVAEVASSMYKAPPKLEVIAPTAEQQQRAEWRYTTEEPSGDWMEASYDASSWKTGRGGFGTQGTPGTTVRNEWSSGEIWLRSEFELRGSTEGLFLNVYHDEDAEIYVNGRQIAKFTGYNGRYELIPVSEDGASAFKRGKNVIAVHCRQTRGGQYIDVGVVRVTEQDQR